MTEQTKRRFICKRCEKPSIDLMGGFTRFSQKHNIDLVYENIDLCKKCFKKTTKEERSVKMLETLVELKILDRNDIESLKRFQVDKQFKRECLNKAGIIKEKGSTNVRKSPSYYKRLAKRKEERELKENA